MSFDPKITIHMTPYQLRKLRPIIKKLKAQQGAVFGQCYLANNMSGKKMGTADFSFLSREQYDIINPALIEARKIPSKP